ncbi:hypothetical protein IHE45_17G006900 [Dioscorea alata]|uniref:Uncharacterized protein n=1 Tax=Dioscorea alata TaxID=55571 RepID=A0ACB7UAE4_DIOAL|nr:hypothetical protein IHE45_17G006900 [Dioscorea alata]
MVKFSVVILISLASMLMMMFSLGSARPSLLNYGGKLPKNVPIPPSGPSGGEAPDTPPLWSSMEFQKEHFGKLPKGPIPPSGPSDLGSPHSSSSKY